MNNYFRLQRHAVHQRALSKLSKTISRIAIGSLLASAALADSNDGNTQTPIKHLIIVIGENHTFDSLFATYQPVNGQTVKNLLSEKIVNADGSPAEKFSIAQQNTAKNIGTAYNLNPTRGEPFEKLPQPIWELGLLDTRFPSTIPNGPFQISKYVPYSGPNSETGDPVHRFFQMWQQTGGDNAKLDLFTWVAVKAGQGGNTPNVTPSHTGQGGELMGFSNMAMGDAAFFKELADHYAISDNYHQSIMGGTGMNFFSIATGDLPVYNINGELTVPPANQIENPNPLPGTENFFTRDGYHGGSYVACSNPTQPGVAAIHDALNAVGRIPNCENNAYYLVNNYDPPFDLFGRQIPLSPTRYIYPPQTVPTIAEALTEKQVSWKWYTGGRDIATTLERYLGSYWGSLIASLLFYNNIGDPLMGSENIVKSAQLNNLQDVSHFYADLTSNNLPAVSYVIPSNGKSGHPGNSAPSLYEAFVKDLIQKVQAQPEIWAETAIVITTDEGGGYFDTGRIQMLDFFGDGPRIPLFVVSPFAKKGYVDHVYHDHASLLKFIEFNWQLPTLSSRSRDQLPNPITLADAYIPLNSPAVGDLMSLFMW